VIPKPTQKAKHREQTGSSRNSGREESVEESFDDVNHPLTPV
jgi:hypothetical protein